MTKAEQIRMGVAKMSDAGESVKDIALVLGLSEDRVEEILDLLDRNEGLPHVDDGQRAPLVEPLLGSSVLQANAPKQQMCRVCGGVDGEHDADQHRNQKAAAKPAARSEVATTATMPGRVVAAPQRKPVVETRPVPEGFEVFDRPAPKQPDHGTVAGYKRHYKLDGKPCDPCRDAYNLSEREKTAALAASKGDTFATTRGPRRKVAVCGTMGGYAKHAQAHEKPCEPCAEARREYQRGRAAQKRAAAGLPPADAQPTQKPRIEIRWLVPRGEELPHGTCVEYEIRRPGPHPGRFPRTNDPEVAEREANSGARVFRRLVTEFMEVTT